MKEKKLIFAHLCDSAFLSHPGGKVNIIGDFSNAFIDKIPGTETIFLPFFVVTNFFLPVGKYKHTVLIQKESDSKIVIHKQDTTLESTKEEERTGFIGSFGVIFPENGKYLVKIFIDDHEFIALPLNINGKE